MTSVRSCKSLILAIAVVGALSVPAFATRTHRAPTSGHSKKKTASHQLHGQRQIDSDRAREIQSALIREHYLTGEPTGSWDLESQAAMSKFQAENGWQTKLTPDSRALIKLGLGPNRETGKVPVSNQASLPIASSTNQPMIPAANSFVSK